MNLFKSKIYDTYSSAKLHKNGNVVTSADLIIWANHTYKRVMHFLPLNKSASVLDIGTGTGNFIFMLQRLGYNNLTGVDISKEQIEIAKKIIPEAKLFYSDISIFLKDKENQYDLISGFDIIEHFTRQEAYDLLLNINKALKPSGRIILQSPNAYSPWMGSVCYGDLTHEWFYTPNSLDDLLIQSGFYKYEAVEVAPVAVGFKGLIRSSMWQIVKFFYKILNSLEIGISGNSQIFSRVFIATAIKKS
jgi:2-polyprenyl-3-methyl-5-hydroxy-6-metoxy-1,4-benzoquinol methylase